MYIVTPQMKDQDFPLSWVVGTDDMYVTIMFLESAEQVESFNVKDSMGNPISDVANHFGTGRLTKG